MHLPKKDENEDQDKKDRKARSIIGMLLSDYHLNHLRGFRIAKKAWKAITDVFERHTLLNKAFACHKFYNVLMEKGEKILEYPNRVRQLSATLKLMIVAIDVKEIAMAALNGLPLTYEELVVTLDPLGSDNETLSFDLVKSRVLQKERRANEREKIVPSSQPSALVSVSDKVNGGYNQNAFYRCTIRDNIDHTEKVC